MPDALPTSACRVNSFIHLPGKLLQAHARDRPGRPELCGKLTALGVSRLFCLLLHGVQFLIPLLLMPSPCPLFRLFPDAGEITESMAVYDAMRRFLAEHFPTKVCTGNNGFHLSVPHSAWSEMAACGPDTQLRQECLAFTHCVASGANTGRIQGQAPTTRMARVAGDSTNFDRQAGKHAPKTRVTRVRAQCGAQCNYRTTSRESTAMTSMVCGTHPKHEGFANPAQTLVMRLLHYRMGWSSSCLWRTAPRRARLR